MFTALVSLLTDQSVRPDVAITGEITLKGLVLPVGGLKEKVLAAKQAGIPTVVVPKRNQKDIEDLPREARRGMKFVYISKAPEVLKAVLDTGGKRKK